MKRWMIVFLVISGVSSSAVPAKNLKLALLMAEEKNNKEANEVLNATTSAFFDSKRFSVIERDQLSKIFQERDLSDFINGSAGDLSNLEGVDMIGIVTYTRERGADLQGARQELFFIDVRLTDVKSGQVLGSVRSRRQSLLFEPTSAYNASQLLLENIREMFPPEGSVIHVSGKDVVVSLGSQEGVKEGDLLEVIQEGEVFFDSDGAALPSLEEMVATLKVVQVAPKLSKCKVKKGDGAFSLGARVRLKDRGDEQKMMGWARRALPFIKKGN